MTHKRKKPGANVIVHSSEETQVEQKQESFMTGMMNRGRLALNTAQRHITDHYVLWTGIGLIWGTAIYLFGTEHGRGVRSQIQKTIGTSFNTAKESAVDSFDKLKNATLDVVDKAFSQLDLGEETAEVAKLRRVV